MSFGSNGQADVDRYSLVVLGSAAVGKTCIIRKYLYNDMPDRYKETVEDLHSRDFNIAGVKLSLDIVDTSFSYPDMRRISIANAHAFLLVYAVDDVASFRNMSDLWDEIASQRKADLHNIPIVVVGNKYDLTENVKIKNGMAETWLRTRRNVDPELGARVCFVPTSVVNGTGILTVFRTLLCLSQFAQNHNLKLKTPNAECNRDEPLVEYPNFTIRTLPANRGSLSRTNSQPSDRQTSVKYPKAKTGSSMEKDSFRHRSFRRPKGAKNGLCSAMNSVEINNTTPPTTTPKLTRAGSLLKRSMSLRRKPKAVYEPVDESDCKIS